MSEWIEHDGQGLPVPAGTLVEMVALKWPSYAEIIAQVGMAGSRGGHSWDWNNDFCHHIIRYRVVRPKAMETIDRILVGVPEREPA